MMMMVIVMMMSQAVDIVVNDMTFIMNMKT